jgi:hypothetical protein
MKNKINENPSFIKTDVSQSVIKPNELRIGNIIKLIHGEKEFNIVRGIDEENVSIDEITFDYTFLNEFKPIEINEEWIIKLGFKLDYKSKFAVNYIIDDDGTIGYDWIKSFGFRIRFYKQHFHHIKYIHQFQNLYFYLTGRELIVA